MTTLYDTLETTRSRPRPFESYCSAKLWNDPHISKGMLDAHLDQSHDVASYRQETIDASIDWITSHVSLSRQATVCDFGCGPGLWTTRFAERGARVTSIDLSERSLRYARGVAKEKDLDIRYVLQDYLDYATEDRYDLITMVQGDFSVLSPDQRSTLLGTFREHLSADGRILLEAFSMTYFRDASEDSHYRFLAAGDYWSPDPHHVFTHHFKYEAEHVLCDKYAVADRHREFDMLVWTQCYSIESLRAVLEQNGLHIESCYSDLAGADLEDDSPRIVLVAAPL